jgi:GT2 family glycosyltransferase
MASLRAMKRPNARRSLHVAIGEDGKIVGILRGVSRKDEIERVAIVLDGVVHGIASPQPAERGTLRFSHDLPRHLIFAELDILGLPGGESLLGPRFGLASTYGIAVEAVETDGLHITGYFAAAPFLATEIGIEFVSSTAIAAQATAQRNGATTPAWHFRVPLRRLPRPGEATTLRPRIGGRLLDAPDLKLSAEVAGYTGCLDSASPTHAEGWALNLRQPGLPVSLDVYVDAARVATVTADTPRADLARQAGMTEACGFSVTLPPHPDPQAGRRISVRLSGTATELAGSPLFIDPAPGYGGCFDSLHGMAAYGWALNHLAPDTVMTVEIVGPDGRILGAGQANQFRGDLLDAGLNGGLCAFKIDLSADFESLIGQDVYARIAGTQLMLSGSPRRVTANPNILRFLKRRQAIRPGILPRLRRRLNFAARGHGVSFIMPVFNTPRAWLIEALESVRGQYCDAWELICVDDGSTEPHVRDILAGYAARDPRVRILSSPQNVGIARAVNFGLRAACHDYVAFIDHDDRVEPDAAWQLIRAAQQTDADLLYSDEAQTSDNTEAITELRLRPAFSHDYYLSHPYFVHMICARTDLARRIGGWDETMSISADVDFVLRMIEASRNVVHVPAVLYRWRTHGASTGHAKQDVVMAATLGALQRHLDRLDTGATASAGVWFNQFRIDWPDPGGKILIVIPTKNKADLLKTVIDSIERTSVGVDYRIVVIDHDSDEAESRAYLKKIARRHVVMPYKGAFNFSRMNNAAVAQHGADADFVLFLNNDVEATQDGFLVRLRRLAARRDVGAVGALLMYADRTVQHAGVVLGFNDSAEHALKFQPVYLDAAGRRNLGYNCALSSTRDYAAVTAACMMIRRAVFDEVGGFDESFGIGFNDTDLCLRIGAAGYRILYDGSTMLYHYESATRSQTQQVFHPEDTKRMITRWGDALREGDRFYSPNLSLRTQDHVPTESEACRIISPARETRLDLKKLRLQS